MIYSVLIIVATILGVSDGKPAVLTWNSPVPVCSAEFTQTTVLKWVEANERAHNAKVTGINFSCVDVEIPELKNES